MKRLLIRLGFRPVAEPPPVGVRPGLALALARGDADTIAMYAAAYALLAAVATVREATADIERGA